MKYATSLVSILFVIASGVEATFACGPFVGIQRVPTVREETRDAKVVFLCTMKNARKTEITGGRQTDMVIEQVFKGGQHLGGQKVFVLNRYIDTPKNKAVKYIVFCDLSKGALDPYRGVSVDHVQYYQQSLATESLPAPKRLAFFFTHLENPNPDIALDALREFRNTDYKHARTMAKRMKPEVFLKRLAKAKDSAEKTRVYATLLGDCGTKAHAAVLESYLTEQTKRKKVTGTEGLLVGLLLLDAERGWTQFRRLFQNREEKFMAKFNGVRAVRFLRDNRSDVVSEKKAAEVLALLLPDQSIADIAIEDLREHKRWEWTARVLELYGKKSHDVRLVQRSIIRFALQCPRPEAKTFIAKIRQVDREFIEDAEELLRLEQQSKNTSK